MIQIRKFPEVFLFGRQLLWDSRQTVNPKVHEKPYLVFPNREDPNRDSIIKLLKEKKEWRDFEIIGLPEDSPQIATQNPGRYLSESAALFLGIPSKNLEVIGITGTNGKTSSVSIARHLLLNQKKKVCEIGTLGLKVWDPAVGVMNPVFEIETGFTTPLGPTLQDIFVQLLHIHVDSVVMEVSSHACTLGRIGGTLFSGAVFTNLTIDHLDFHKNMENYEAAKTSFFTEFLVGPFKEIKVEKKFENNPKASIVGSVTSTKVGTRIFDKIPPGITKKYSSLDQNCAEIKRTLEGSVFTWLPQQRKISLPLLGDFQIENFLGVAGLFDENTYSFENFSGIPGRMQKVGGAQSKKHVFVDYAHTPDALERALKSLAALKKSNQRLFVVFGCGGDRDKIKRPLMGSIAAQFADRVFLTHDNPRTESAMQIIDQIRGGMPSGSDAIIEPDRAKAIRLAIDEMAEGDICLIAGKGHENDQIIGKDRFPFSDSETALKYLTQS